MVLRLLNIFMVYSFPRRANRTSGRAAELVFSRGIPKFLPNYTEHHIQFSSAETDRAYVIAYVQNLTFY